METPRKLNIVLKYDEETGIYTGYFPDMKPVRFSDESEEKVVELVKEGIKLYLDAYPNFFENYREIEI